MEPPIKLERFAALSAEIDLGAPRDDVIAREKIAPETWEEAQEIWLAKMADEASRKRFEITNRYNTTFVATRRVLEAKRARPPRPKKEPPAPKRKPEAAPPPVEPAEPVPPLVAASPFGVDLVARAPERTPPPLQVAAPPPFVAPPSGPAIAPPAPAMAPPVAYAPPSGAPSPPPPAVVARKAHPLESTAPGMTPSPALGSLPFRPGDGAAAIPPASAPKPRKRNVGKTMAFTAPVTAEALPFQQAAKAAAAPVSPSPPAKAAPSPVGAPGSTPPPEPARATPPSGAPPAAAPKPAPAAKKVDLGATMGLADDRFSFVSSASLPFSTQGGAPKGKAAAAPSAAATPFHAEPSRSPAPPPGATPVPPKGAAAPDAGAARAGDKAALASGSRFTMEQFASLTAEIAAAPAKIGEVRARYGLDEPAHRAEAERWQRLFAADKDLFARYTEAFQHYRDWLARGRR